MSKKQKRVFWPITVTGIAIAAVLAFVSGRAMTSAGSFVRSKEVSTGGGGIDHSSSSLATVGKPRIETEIITITPRGLRTALLLRTG